MKNKHIPTDTINNFIRKVLQDEGCTTRQVAWHEAGHSFFWQQLFPEADAQYRVVNGHPAVAPARGGKSIDLASLAEKDAAKYIYIKLGGVAAEMIMLGMGQHATEIAEWLADDMAMSKKQQSLDWDDDEDAGGDMAEAAKIICAKAGRQSLKPNLSKFLVSCVGLLDDNDEFQNECAKAEALFASWESAGLWSMDTL